MSGTRTRLGAFILIAPGIDLNRSYWFSSTWRHQIVASHSTRLRHAVSLRAYRHHRWEKTPQGCSRWLLSCVKTWPSLHKLVHKRGICSWRPLICTSTGALKKNDVIYPIKQQAGKSPAFTPLSLSVRLFAALHRWCVTHIAMPRTPGLCIFPPLLLPPPPRALTYIWTLIAEIWAERKLKGLTYLSSENKPDVTKVV